MKVLITENGTGLLNGLPYPSAGEEVELPEGLAVSLVGDGRAELVASVPAEKPEKAAEAAPVKRGPGRPRKGA